MHLLVCHRHVITHAESDQVEMQGRDWVGRIFYSDSGHLILDFHLSLEDAGGTVSEIMFTMALIQPHVTTAQVTITSAIERLH